MGKIVLFSKKLFASIKDNELIAAANELTYKLLLGLFPFIIFLMSLIGFFDIDSSHYLERFAGVFPDIIYNIIKVFVAEVVEVRNPGVLSLSLLITVYSAASGFMAVIRGINRAYGYKETRGFIRLRLVSILLVIIFAAGIILSIASLVFGDIIHVWLEQFIEMTPAIRFMAGFFRYIITMVVLLLSIIVIYLFASGKKVPFYSVIPGALTTLIVWIAASKFFNIYINNFSKYSTIYGSIGSIFVLMYWINIIAITMLIGGTINALLDEDPETP